MPRPNPVRRTTLEEYFRLEAGSEFRHEFVDGFMFAMAGISDNHNRIANNINVRAYLAGQPGCEVYIGDVKLLTPGEKVYYPDVFLTCQEINEGAHHKRFPCWVVEVLSDSTEAVDRGEKLHSYQKIPTLKAYVLVSQQRRMVETFRRLEDGSWRYEALEEEGLLELPCLDLRLSLEEIYRGVGFNPTLN
jgi:Uma2 family endonuclease